MKNATIMAYKGSVARLSSLSISSSCLRKFPALPIFVVLGLCIISATIPCANSTSWSSSPSRWTRSVFVSMSAPSSDPLPSPSDTKKEEIHLDPNDIQEPQHNGNNHEEKEKANATSTTTESDLPGVGFTAKIMAAVRAWETSRAIEKGDIDTPPRLFEDPFAEALAGAHAMETFYKNLKGNDSGPSFSRLFTVRTRFHDDAITENLDHVHQVVILGSGMDTRAYRLPGLTPAVTLWEVDSSQVHEYKNQILKLQNAATTPKCRRIVIATDLHTSEWVERLLETGFDTSQPTVWILEGLIYYLTPASAEDLLHRISTLSAPKSVFAADFMNQANRVKPESTWKHMWKFTCEDPVALLERHGWSNVQPKLAYEIARQKYPGYDKEGIVFDARAREEKVWYVHATRR